MGASSVCVIAECGGSPLLVGNHLNGCGLGLAVMEQGLFLNMRTCRQADSHVALVNVASQRVVTWPSTKTVSVLCHGERKLWSG